MPWAAASGVECTPETRTLACAWIWAYASTSRCACVPSPTFPLVAGGFGHECELLETLYSEAFLGYPKLRWPLPLSTSPLEGSFHTRGNRRGPVWPVIAWPRGGR